MIKNANFLNHQWLWPIILTAIFIWLVFIWKERSKYSSIKFYLNISIALISVSALALITLKPLKISSGKSYKAIVLTEGYNQKQLDSLEQNYKDLMILNYKSDVQLFYNIEKPESVFILGDGIPSYDLWQLDGIETDYLKGQEPKGVVKIYYDTKTTVGKNLTFKGRYLNGEKGQKLVLEDPSGKPIDSVILSSTREQVFELTTNSKTVGNFLYQLVEKDSLDTSLAKNPLPVSVIKEESLKVLIINDFPTFETKYIKNYLSKKGHQVLIRSQLTKDRYKYEYFNMSRRSFANFSQKNLQFFDLMTIDAAALKKLSRSQQNAIKSAISEDGLGVYIQPDLGFFSFNNSLMSFNFQGDKNASVTLDAWPRAKIGLYPYRFKPEFALQPLHVSGTKILSGYKRLGLGRIGTSLVNNSYELLLSGKKELYEALWSKHIEGLSKTTLSSVAWRTDSFIGFENEPMDFTLRTALAEPNVSTQDAIEISLEQDMHIAALWKGRAYPKQLGWNTLKIEQDSIAKLHYYAANPGTWDALKTHQTIEANQRHFNNGSNSSITTASGPMIPMDLKWFYIIFILSIGYLWLEPKL